MGEFSLCETYFRYTGCHFKCRFDRIMAENTGGTYMTKNSVGQFIAALRKANGMTQQDVADRLNVSNKSVSRWERDECAPDISLIPAIAEMFGVTCDELLMGKRISQATPAEKSEPKIEKQVNRLIGKTLSSFKTYVYISLALSLTGLVCMFGISYGFYRPVIGFAVMLLFEICAFLLTAIATGKTKDVKADNELFKMANNALILKFNRTFASMSFVSFFTSTAVVLLSLPLILVKSDYIDSVLSLQSYFSSFFIVILILLLFAYFKLKDLYENRITHGEIPKKQHIQTVSASRKMTGIQVSLTVAAGILLLIGPYFDRDPNQTSIISVICAVFALMLSAMNIVTFTVFLIKNNDRYKTLILHGVRNMLLIIPSFLLSRSHSVAWYGSEMAREDYWSTRYIWYALLLTLVIITVFYLIELLLKKNRNT